MLKFNKEFKRVLWYSPIVAAMILPAACGSKKSDDTTPAPAATQQQLQPSPVSTPTPTTTPTTTGVAATMAAISFQIANASTLASQIDSKTGGLTIQFQINTTATSSLNILCKLASSTDTTAASFQACTSTTTFGVTGLTAGTYTFSIEAQDQATGIASPVTTATFTLGSATQAQPVVVPVGSHWTLTIPQSLAIQEYAEIAATGINYYKYAGPATSTATPPYGAGIATLQDGSGELNNYFLYSGLSYKETSASQPSFVSLTNNRMVPNSISLSTIPAALAQQAPYEYVVINAFSSTDFQAMGMGNNYDFNNSRDYFVMWCGPNSTNGQVNATPWAQTYIPGVLIPQRPAQIRICTTRNQGKTLVAAQILAANSTTGNWDTEIVYAADPQALSAAGYNVSTPTDIAAWVIKRMYSNLAPH